VSTRGILWRERARRTFGTERIVLGDVELLVLIACNLVTTIGLAGDIARHHDNPGNLGNDFLSSWHLVLYGGVTSVGVWLGVGAIRHGLGFLWSAAATTIGFALLALGGVVDAAWHARFGVEVEVEALVSPPHLLVFAGLIFLLTSPILVIWRRAARRLGFVASFAVLSSTVCAVLVTSLFTGFLSPLASGMSLQPDYVEPLVGESPVPYDQVRGLGIAIFTVVLLVAAFTAILVRFRLMPGMVAIGFCLCALPALFISGSALRPLVLGYTMAGLVAEGMVALVGRPTLGRLGAAVTGGLAAAMLWAATFAMLARDDRLGWTTSLWSGTIVLSGLVGAAVAALVALPAPTGDAVVDSPLGPRPA
jgi:hypothetical protein